MYKFSVLLLFCFVIVQLASAQDSKSESKIKPPKSFLTDSSRWSIEVPIWIPGFRGDFAYGDVSLEGEDGLTPEHPIEPGWQPGDILKRIFDSDGHFNFFFMNRIAYNNKKIYGQFDMFSGSVGGELYFKYNNGDLVQGKFSTYLFRMIAGYKVYEKLSLSEKRKYKLYAYGGVRIHNVNVKSELDDVRELFRINPLWPEPVLGFRNELVFKNWLFVLQGDVGSFGINRKFSYMINLHGFYRISKLLSVKAGWCDWDINYRDKYLKQDLKLKIHLSGPSTALSFHF